MRVKCSVYIEQQGSGCLLVIYEMVRFMDNRVYDFYRAGCSTGNCAPYVLCGRAKQLIIS